MFLKTLKLRSTAMLALAWDHVGFPGVMNKSVMNKPWHQNRKTKAKALLDRCLRKRVRLAEKRFFDKIIQEAIDPAQPIFKGKERALQRLQEQENRFEDFLFEWDAMAELEKLFGSEGGIDADTGDREIDLGDEESLALYP